VQYKIATSSGKVSNIIVDDYLPEQLTLVSGKLVTKAEDATAEWKEVSYTAKLSSDIKLTLQNSSIEILLSGATVRYSRGGNIDSLTTNPVTITTKMTPPHGKYDQPLPIAFFALVLPILAGVFLINIFHSKALAKSSRKQSSQTVKKDN